MRLVKVVFALLTWLSIAVGSCSQADAWVHGNAGSPLPIPDVVCNIVTGVATGLGAGTCASTPATCDGVADDSPSFATFNAWAINIWQASHAGTIELFAPSGKSCIWLTNAGSNFTHGIKKLFISAYGATFSNAGSGSVIFNFGIDAICHRGLSDASGCSARTATASPGDTSVTLLNTSLCSRFTAGTWTNMTGFDVQGLWNSPFGYPPNLYFHDYVKITDTSTCGSNGHVVFTPALTHTYKSTWPNFNSGNSGESDAGGPATLYELDNQWDIDLYIAGLTIDQTSVQTAAVGRNVTFRDVKANGQNCIYSTQNLSWVVINSDLSTCVVEMDKLVTSATIQNTAVFELDFQSGGFDTFNLINSPVTNAIQGTPRKFVGSNSTITQITLGPQNYGRADEFICTNCVINSLAPKGPVHSILGSWSMSGGIITIPNTASVGIDGNQEAGFVPGTNVMWQGSHQSELLFHVVDVTQDATNIYVQTDAAGGFPATSPTKIFDHPAPKFTCTACTGSDPQIASLTQAPAGAPLYSFQTYTYTGAIGSTPQSSFDVWGNLSSVSLNVTNAYTGTGSLNFFLAQFQNWNLLNSSDVSVNYGPTVNAKTAGNRVQAISGGSITVTGAQTGDCLSGATCGVPDAVQSWFTGIVGAGAIYSADVSGSCPGPNCPSVTVTIQTNQGVVNP